MKPCDDRPIARLGFDFALSPEWQAEIARRVPEIESGKAKLIPAEDVFRNARAAIS